MLDIFLSGLLLPQLVEQMLRNKGLKKMRQERIELPTLGL